MDEQNEGASKAIKQADAKIADAVAVAEKKNEEKKKAKSSDVEEEKKVEATQSTNLTATKRSRPARAAKAVPTNVIAIENLPINFSRLMLEELFKNYQGVDSIVEVDGPACRAVIRFDSVDQAKFAVVGLNRFRVDQSGRELRVNFHN